MQLTPEERGKEIMNSYIQFFQLDDSVPEIDSKDLCPRCKGSIYVNRKEAMLQCMSCALTMPYLTVRSNVRIITAKPHLSTSSPENKQWNRFISALSQHKYGESPITDAILTQISQWIKLYKHVRNKQPVKTSMIQ